MPKRKAAVVAEAATNSESETADNAEAESPPKKGKATPKKAAVARGRGRPPLSGEEKVKRDAAKAPKSGRGRGRPKGSTATKKTKSPKKK